MRSAIQIKEVLQPAGECIYCGATEDLSTEHIIPLSLGGKTELPRASCGRCRDLTSRIEFDVARTSLHGQRALSGLPSRRAKKFPRTFLVRIKLKNGKVLKRQVPLHEAPIFHYVPFFELPQGTSVTDDELIAHHVSRPAHRQNAEQLWKRLRRSDGVSTSIDAQFNIDAYPLLLWKIASGFFWSADRESYLASQCRERVLSRRNMKHPEGGLVDLFSVDRGMRPVGRGVAAGEVQTSPDGRWLFCSIDILGNMGFPIYICRIPTVPHES